MNWRSIGHGRPSSAAERRGLGPHRDDSGTEQIGRGGSAPISDRDFVEAMLYLARTGCPWRDLPERFGAWDAVYQRFRRWQRRGIWQALFARLPGELATVETLLLDSTIVRAHVHAAGAPKKRAGKKRKPWVAAAAAGAPSCTSRPA